MKLTQDQIQSVIRRINEVSPRGIVCPICGQRHWNINDVVIESREFQNGDFILGGESAIIPFVSLNCTNCGNTILFNALHLGVVNRTPTNNVENNGR